MTATPPPHSWRRRVKWVIGVTAAALVLVVAAVTIWLSEALKPAQEAPMRNGDVAAQQDDLRSKGSAEEALRRYETLLAQTADQIIALVPGLTWRWYYEDTTVSCTGPLAGTGAVQILTRHVVFDGPVPDAQWPAAVGIVAERAAAFGADDVFTFKDNPGDHDIAISGADGVEFRFGTKVATNLSARSGCHLEQADLTRDGS